MEKEVATERLFTADEKDQLKSLLEVALPIVQEEKERRRRQNAGQEVNEEELKEDLLYCFIV